LDDLPIGPHQAVRQFGAGIPAPAELGAVADGAIGVRNPAEAVGQCLAISTTTRSSSRRNPATDRLAVRWRSVLGRPESSLLSEIRPARQATLSGRRFRRPAPVTTAATRCRMRCAVQACSTTPAGRQIRWYTTRSHPRNTWGQGVAGSNPAIPTQRLPHLIPQVGRPFSFWRQPSVIDQPVLERRDERFAAGVVHLHVTRPTAPAPSSTDIVPPQPSAVAAMIFFRSGAVRWAVLAARTSASTDSKTGHSWPGPSGNSRIQRISRVTPP
jgi:hypothetical protein